MLVSKIAIYQQIFQEQKKENSIKTNYPETFLERKLRGLQFEAIKFN